MPNVFLCHYVYPDDIPEGVDEVLVCHKGSVEFVSSDGLDYGDIWRYNDETPSPEIQARSEIVKEHGPNA